jgi:uroporphyrinogen decarboxylase
MAGEPVDRLPAALWRHFYVEEVSREGLVAAMLAWQEEYGWDLLKINPRFGYHCEDWGNRYETSGRADIAPSLVHAAVRRAHDFRHLDLLSAGDGGGDGRPARVLTDHLGAVADLRAALGPDVPMLMTIFSPMSIAAELAGGPQDLAGLIAEDAEAVHAGLRTITDTFAAFAAACVEAGADGIFFATTHVATELNFTPAQYAAFGRPYDLEVLAAAARAPLNLLHVCKSRAMVRPLADYPCPMLNWDMADPTNPSLADMAAAAPGKTLVGGVDRALFSPPADGPSPAAGAPADAASAADAIRAQVAAARQAMGTRPFVLGSTCTIDPTSDPALVRLLRELA